MRGSKYGIHKRLLYGSFILESVILICYIVTAVVLKATWALLVFTICESLFLLVLIIVVLGRQGYFTSFKRKQTLKQVDTHLSAAELEDWVDFSNRFNQEPLGKESTLDAFSVVDTLEKAEKQWQRERRTERGIMQYDRILGNYKAYVTTCSLNINLSATRECELDIIQYMIRDNASIKHQDSIIHFCIRHGRTRGIALEAIDQLLIKRIIVIAMEGSLDYYRINLGWNITRDIQKEKRALMEQDKEKVMKITESPKKQVLSQTKVEKQEADDIAKTVSYYREQSKMQLIECLLSETEPVSMLEMLNKHRELGTINRLSLEEIMKELVQKGQVIIIEDEYPVKYRLVKI